MNRTEKQTFVDEFREKIRAAPVLYLTDFSGLDVKSMTLLRQRLKDSGAEYLVVKNRLAKLAVADLDLPDISEALLGPTGVVLGYKGIVEPAKAVSDFAKEHDDKPIFKLGIIDNLLVSAEEIQRLAKLPPREQLLAELAGALEAPMAALVSALEGKVQEMAGLLEALREQKEDGGPGESPTVDAEAAETEAETAEPEAEAAESEADTAEPEAEAAETEADTAEPEAEAAETEADTAEPEAEAAETEADTAEPEAEAAETEADTAEPEAEAAETDADTAEPETEAAQTEADIDEPEAETAEPEAEAPDPEKEN